MKACVATLLASFVLISGAVAQEGPREIGMYQLAYPFPSPDGDRLAFQSNMDGRWQLYEMTLVTGAVRRLHVSPANDTHPAWSPDGGRIAFISNRDGNDEVYVLDVATGEARVVAAHPGRDGHPKWSADGEWLVFNRTFDPADTGGENDSAIMRARVAGGEAVVLSDSPNIETFASFSPDGRFVAFVEWMPGADGERYGDIVIVEIATARRRNVTASPEFDAYPYWAASGEWIYYSSVVGDAAEAREAILRRVRVRDGFVQNLAPRDGVGEVRAIPDHLEQTIFFNRSGTAFPRVEIFSAPIRVVD